ncbi:hypothetical protein [Cellulomonas sp. Leaf395]|uniref:hypothetical protein n=1 Tax=Cellulomonas sp. Leaf395 TaxID=1736362 RepID=UPI0006F276A3|nr:hypothetical protein [Cellulomonas sp. Leaf395]KQT01290.1 hypothetical protein ASG23_06890 [Cellulomonas sp. Leaf395]
MSTESKSTIPTLALIPPYSKRKVPANAAPGSPVRKKRRSSRSRFAPPGTAWRARSIAKTGM